MKDRFRFRIWNGAEMHYTDFVVTATGYVGKITEEFLGQCVFRQDDLTADDESILMQSTGLGDKNERLIFEGDIVKAYYINSDTNKQEFDLMKVVYDEKVCAFGLLGFKTNYFSDFISTEWEQEEYEVIGNIYENEDLLNYEDNA